jgi:hypothetical protein
LYRDWQQWQLRRKEEGDRQSKARQLKEQKELFERMKEARKRQIY